MQLQNQTLTFIHQKKSLFTATSILSCSPMAYNNTASFDKLTCTVDFGNFQDRFGRITCSKNDSNSLDVKLKYSRRMTTKNSDWSNILQWERPILTGLSG